MLVGATPGTTCFNTNLCLSSAGVLRLGSLRRLQPGLLHDSGSKQPAQLVEVQTLPSSSSSSSSLTNTGSQNSPSMSCQHSEKKNNNNQPVAAGAAASWISSSSNKPQSVISNHERARKGGSFPSLLSGAPRVVEGTDFGSWAGQYPPPLTTPPATLTPVLSRSEFLYALNFCPPAPFLVSFSWGRCRGCLFN